MPITRYAIVPTSFRGDHCPRLYLQHQPCQSRPRPRRHQVTFCFLKETTAKDQLFPEGDGKPECVYILYTFRRGVQYILNFFKIKTLRISTVYRDFHHSLEASSSASCTPRHVGTRP